MSKQKFTARQREDAADALAYIASSHHSFYYFKTYPISINDFFSCSDPTYDLASSAFRAAPMFDERNRQIPWPEVWAEAEAMLRTGWSP